MRQQKRRLLSAHTAGLALFALLIPMAAEAQTAPLRYWVQFSEKSAASDYPFDLDSPAQFLGERSLDRRAAQSIPIDALDLPVHPRFLSELGGLPEIDVVCWSRWLNAATIAVADSSTDLAPVLALPFVLEIRRAAVRPVTPKLPPASPPTSTLRPDLSATALDLLRGRCLHDLGFRGEGMKIGILDAGFQDMDRLPIFEHAWADNRIQVGLDVKNSPEGVFAHHRHGTAITSTMIADSPGQLLGTAPDATYVLYRTEDVTSEYVIEEDYWIMAAEHADSSGCDLLNTSLGYSLFDDTLMNHEYTDLNGLTNRISIASGIAATRGMLVATSAGNSGDDPWHFITSPADALNILAVGAVHASGEHAAFSGFGPTSDGRTKPEVMALGADTPYARHDTTIATGNGTSFSSPILCGMAASLWQAAPSATSEQLRQAIIDSASLRDAPNDSMGYGIPDFCIALELLQASPWGTADGEASVVLYPNPTYGILRWVLPAELLPEDVSVPIDWSIHDATGALINVGSDPSTRDKGEVVDRAGWTDLSPLSLSAGRYAITWSAEGSCIAVKSFLLVGIH